VRVGVVILALCGLAAAVGMIVYNDAGLVMATLLSQGRGLAIVVSFHAVPLVIAAIAWWLVAKPEWCGRWGVFLWARILREAVNDLLPLAQVGGPFASARALVVHGVPVGPATGSLVVDLTSEVSSQVVFAFLGLALLAAVGGAPEMLRWGLVGVSLMLVAVIGFVAAQRFGLIRVLDRTVSTMVRHWNGSARPTFANLHATVWRIYARRRRVALGFMLHVACWTIGTVEVWLALRFLGHPVSLEAAFIIESLGQAIRGAAFIVPGGLGVQEGGFVLLGAAFGIDPQTSLALSLTKRVRELSIGLPALMVWHFIEGQRLFGATRMREPLRSAD
jgi:putative membrane protein